MRDEEARKILTARRPSGADDADPEMAAALARVARDPVLAAWHAARNREDAAIADALRTVPVPPGLRERILAGGPALGSTHPRRWWTPVLAWAAALMVLLGVGGALVWQPMKGPVHLARAETDLAGFLDREWDHSFDLSSPEFAVLRGWLAGKPSGTQFTVPDRLARSRTFGCKTFRYRGGSLSLICFVPEPTGPVVHVFSLPAGMIEDRLDGDIRTGSAAGWTTAAWRRDDRVYLAFSTVPPERIRTWL